MPGITSAETNEAELRIRRRLLRQVAPRTAVRALDRSWADEELESAIPQSSCVSAKAVPRKTSSKEGGLSEAETT